MSAAATQGRRQSSGITVTTPAGFAVGFDRRAQRGHRVEAGAADGNT
jgi:hypothetical protein